MYWGYSYSLGIEVFFHAFFPVEVIGEVDEVVDFPLAVIHDDDDPYLRNISHIMQVERYGCAILLIHLSHLDIGGEEIAGILSHDPRVSFEESYLIFFTVVFNDGLDGVFPVCRTIFLVIVRCLDRKSVV